MKKFPHTVQLHRKFQADGLVVMSLDINQDEFKGKEKEKVVKFLTEQKADFPNYIFRDDEDAAYKWLEKHDATGTPALVAFDRTGKWVPVPEFKNEAEEEEFLKTLLSAK